jgi:hypothetical protein
MVAPVVGGEIPYSHGSETMGRAEGNGLIDIANMAKKAVGGVAQQKKQREMIAAARDFEVLTNAIQMRAANPNDEFNTKLINMMLDPDSPEGAKRIKRLQKVFAFEESDFQAKQKRNEDPDAQAWDAAVKKSGGVVPMPGGGTMPIPTAGQTQPQEKQPEYMAGLNPTAQKFLSNFPQMAQPIKYLPGPQEIAQATRVAMKIIPEPDKALEFSSKLMDFQIQSGIQLGKHMESINKATIDGEAKIFGDVNRGLMVALLKQESDAQDREIAKWGLGLKAQELGLKAKEMTLEQANQMSTVTHNRVLTTQKLYENYTEFEKTGEFEKLRDDKDWYKNYEKEKETARTNYINAHRQNDKAWEVQQFVINKVTGVPTPPADREKEEDGAAALREYLSGSQNGATAKSHADTTGASSGAVVPGASTDGTLFSSGGAGKRYNTVTGKYETVVTRSR